jgi:hypothetical protein
VRVGADQRITEIRQEADGIELATLVVKRGVGDDPESVIGCKFAENPVGIGERRPMGVAVGLVALEPGSGFLVRQGGQLGLPDAGEELPGAFALLPDEGELAVEETGVLRLRDRLPEGQHLAGIREPIEDSFGSQMREHADFFCHRVVEQGVVHIEKHAPDRQDGSFW